MSPPNEKQALSALAVVQSLTGPELQACLDEELGMPMLGVLDSLARAAFPDTSVEQHHRTVHLMVLSYLMSREAMRDKSCLS